MKSDNSERRDWRISVILIAIWAVGMTLLSAGRDDIPLSMLAIATVFFVFLVPAMNDLVRSIERWVMGDDANMRESKHRN